ncbi:enoyl-CoA hydratase [Roseomonas sp. KE2513]|uniref:crotonase/enoyl-CoA hydratase family protein n=1 Tax=Roseomonas sp. KE2513 TaxID=2479202 RepID=UPI0018E00430|nr:crotonase/enoyl-CoA hydratase family protein [Roseomonas sp. KE2513]MBI0538799.1 enoyl-CoA hydratase [Roseomonas sp. KE2513]
MNNQATSFISCELRGAVQVLSFERPDKRNAVNEATLAELRRLITDVPPEIRVVVLAGAGEHFCAGLDLAEQKERTQIEVMKISREWHAVLDQLQYSGRPVVVALTGAVIGGGFEIATAAHVRVADETAFFRLPEAKRGFYIGGGGSVRISRAIGLSRMTEMLLTGRTLGAEKAELIGLVHEVVQRGDAKTRALELAEEIAGNTPFVNFLVTNALPRITDMSATDGLFTESLAAALSQDAGEVRSGIDAFFASRPAARSE